MTVTVGCSGWSYADWVGRFFPFELRDDNAKRFEHYSELFTTVEINSTFYRMPGDKQVESWVEKARTHPGFEFSAIMPRSVTHEALVDLDDRTAIKHAQFFEKVMALPLNDVGGLGAIILQMSPSFHNNGESSEVLSRFLGSLAVGEFHYAIEFRHLSWLNENHHLLGETFRLLRDNHIANVMVDGPGLAFNSDLTADSACVRFHGRNFDVWHHDEGEGERTERYDYLYDEEQLQPWASRIREMAERVPRVRVFFDNHGKAKSAKNAFELMDMLSIPHREKAVHVQDQARLDEF